MSAKFSARDGGLRFALKLTPRGGRDAVDGWAEDADGKPYLKARVTPAPEDGKANKALIGLLSKTLDVSKSAIRIAAGETSRLKTIEIDGDRAELGARLSEL